MTFVECEKIGNSPESVCLRVKNFMGRPFTAIAQNSDLREFENKLYVPVRSVTTTRNDTAIIEVDDIDCRRKIIVATETLRNME